MLYLYLYLIDYILKETDSTNVQYDPLDGFLVQGFLLRGPGLERASACGCKELGVRVGSSG